METAVEEVETLPQIKVEPIGYNYDPSEYDHQSINEIDVGREFKIDPLLIDQASDVCSTLPDNQSTNNCTQCSKILADPSNKVTSTCSDCESEAIHSEKIIKLELPIIPARKHSKSKSNLKSTYHCDHCKYKAHKKQHLSSHIKIKHFPRDFELIKCKRCGNSCSRLGLRYHMKECRANKKLLKKLLCNKCSYGTTRRESLARHIQSKHSSDTFRCKMCDKSYTNQFDLYDHARRTCKKLVHTIKKGISCDHCGYKTYSKPCLVEHIFAKHTDEHQNKCDKCARTYKWSSSLKKHEKVCGQSKEFKLSLKRYHNCDTCGYQTYRKDHLVAHIQSMHMKNVRFPCTNDNKCKGTFANQRSLYYHVTRSCKFKKSNK